MADPTREGSHKMSDTDPKDPKDTPEDKPDKGDDKDAAAEAAKWKALARKHEAKAKENADAAARLAKIEEEQKTAEQKAADKAAEAEKRAAEAELKALRLEIAHEKGLTPAQAKRISGTTREELESDADEFLESIKPGDEKDRPSGKPREDLKGGGDPTDEPAEMDPKKLAEAIPRY